MKLFLLIKIIIEKIKIIKFILNFILIWKEKYNFKYKNTVKLIKITTKEKIIFIESIKKSKLKFKLLKIINLKKIFFLENINKNKKINNNIKIIFL